MFAEHLLEGANTVQPIVKTRLHIITGVNEMKYKDGEPCKHPGCLNHVTHACEGCGRIAGINLKENKMECEHKVFKGVKKEFTSKSWQVCTECGYRRPAPPKASAIDTATNILNEFIAAWDDCGAYPDMQFERDRIQAVYDRAHKFLDNQASNFWK